MLYKFEAHCDDDNEIRELFITAQNFDEAVTLAFAELAKDDHPENNPSSWALLLVEIRR